MSEMLKLFQQITIGNSLMSIRSVFQPNKEGYGYSLKYDPAYQRNFVWNETKMTSLIESILLHGEVPPVCFYQSEQMHEAIDGRQRCETIDRYLQNSFPLKAQGLDKLWNLAGKRFSQLDESLRERILETVLRFIIIEPKNKNEFGVLKEDRIKREIFKRYNRGISPLKKEEVSKAQYLQDEINIHFKKAFAEDIPFLKQIAALFNHRSKNLETLMQHIRQLLVLHHIPISKYLSEREDIVNKYYDYLSWETLKGRKEDVERIFVGFKRKIRFLLEIVTLLNDEKVTSNGVINECLYWALSVCEKEKVKFETINNQVFKDRLIRHIRKHIIDYPIDRNTYVQQIKTRYTLISGFFASQIDISFDSYLKSDDEFISAHKERMTQYLSERFKPGEEQEFFSKALPTSVTVSDILDRMKRKKFCVRPPYQRMEVMNRSKASLLIESMLLGMKLPPIYIYLREDGVWEVIDGQQRLLAIIGYLGETYLDEHDRFVISGKDKFSLDLPSAILPDIHRKKFSQLSESDQRSIYTFSLDVIEIREKDNKHFKPEELFKRLNSKPFPIKEHTFEYWNSYVDGTITSSIKEICERNKWLYLRKVDHRMLNQELVTCLAYLNCMTSHAVPGIESMKEVLSIYKSQTCITIKIRDKAFITHMLEDQAYKETFLLSLIDFERDFCEKVKLLAANPNGKITETSFNRRLDNILQTGSMRLSMSFYVLWMMLKELPAEYIKAERAAVQNRISKLFSLLKMSDSIEKIGKYILDTWALSRSFDNRA